MVGILDVMGVVMGVSRGGIFTRDGGLDGGFECWEF